MELDLQSLAHYLNESGQMDLKFSEMTRLGIRNFCEQIHCITTEGTGWRPPYLNEKQELVIPADAPPKYRYWNGGQSLKETLIEMEVSNEIMQRYVKTESTGKTRFEKGKDD